MESYYPTDFIPNAHNKYRKINAAWISNAIDGKEYKNLTNATVEVIDLYKEAVFGKPIQRTYTIRFDNGSLFLERGDTKINIADIFPHITFRQSDRFRVSYFSPDKGKTDIIEFDTSRINTLGFMPALAHEIGHTFVLDKVLNYKLDDEINVAAQQRNKKGIDPSVENFSKAKEELQLQKKKEENIVSSICERSARKRSLMVNERLKQEGFNPYEGFESMSHVWELIDLQLLRYKITREQFKFSDKNRLFLP